MTETTKEIIKKYIVIRDEIDRNCTQLHQQHFENTMCRKGCSECCMNFSVLPIEFHSILNNITKNPPKLNNNTDKDSCLFLIDNSCSIYEHRPSICRSHGLPILNMDEEGENLELSFCPLNFTKVEDDYFSLENGFQQDLYNSKLYLANCAFIKEFKQVIYSENELIELRRLKEFI